MTSPAQCRFCADYYLSYRCLLPAAGALIDAANAGVEDDASIAAAAEFAFMQRDRLTVANEIMQYHPVPPMTNNPQPVTPDDVRDLLGTGRMEAALVRWLTADQWHDAGEVEVVSGVMLRDMQYARSGYDSDDPDDGPDYELIITANDLRGAGDTDWDNPSPDDLAAAAEWLNSPA